MSTRKSKSGTLTVALAVIGSATLASFLWPKQNELSIPIGSPLDPNLGVADPSLIGAANLKDQENHPVTGEMMATAQGQSQKKAPEFELPDGNGSRHTIASLTAGGKPVLIFFIEKKCPCCLGAKHFVDSIADNFKGKASVVGVINASGEEAATWRKLTDPHFLVLEDPNQLAIRAYAAERGVYTTLITPEGTIEKAYPGYSIETLKDISSRLAKWAGVPDSGFESPAAPLELTSGCLFPPVKSEQENKLKEETK
jgi:peroxiredoxin